MVIEDIRKLLNSTKTITFSKHFYEHAIKIRGISEEEVKNELKCTTKLISYEDQGFDERGHKYSLLFSKSNKYDMRIVVSIKDNNINVITTHIQNIKRRKVLEKWIKKRK